VTHDTLKPRHQFAVTAIGQALTLQTDPDAWYGLVPVLGARLTPFERGCLAAVALEATEDEQVIEIAQTVAPRRFAGAPLPGFLDVDAEARWWADLASAAEIKAWLTACFLRLPKREQAGFLAAAGRRVAA